MSRSAHQHKLQAMSLEEEGEEERQRVHPLSLCHVSRMLTYADLY